MRRVEVYCRTCSVSVRTDQSALPTNLVPAVAAPGAGGARSSQLVRRLPGARCHYGWCERDKWDTPGHYGTSHCQHQFRLHWLLEGGRQRVTAWSVVSGQAGWYFWQNNNNRSEQWLYAGRSQLCRLQAVITRSSWSDKTRQVFSPRNELRRWPGPSYVIPR